MISCQKKQKDFYFAKVYWLFPKEKTTMKYFSLDQLDNTLFLNRPKYILISNKLINN